MLDWLVFGLIVFLAACVFVSLATSKKGDKSLGPFVTEIAVGILCFIAAVHVWSAWL